MHRTQALQLDQINGNPGVLPIKEGQAYIQLDNWLIVKNINLDGISKDLNFNVHKYSEYINILEREFQYKHEFREMKIHTDYLKDITLEKLQELVPTNRFKRGLLNPVGSLIKIITGNLDQSDATKYDILISEIKSKEQATKRKITLISEMLDHFMNSSEIIKENTAIIDTRLDRLERIVLELDNEGNDTMYSIYVLSLFNQFSMNFRTIYIKLSELETALALSKTSVLHKSVINSTELLCTLKDIERQNSLIYTVSEQNLIMIEEILTVKTYITPNQITFLIEVPLTDNLTYNYYKLYSLPILDHTMNETVIVVPKYPYLLANGMKYQPVLRPCRDIAKEQYLCTEHDLVEYHETTCIEQLMQFYPNPTQCNQYPVEIESVKVQRVSSHSWILYSRHQTLLSHQCGSDMTRQIVHGTYIISIEEGCSAIINNISIEGKRTYLNVANKPMPVIRLPDLHKRNETVSEIMNLKEINLDDVKFLNYALKRNSVSVSEVKNGISDDRVIQTHNISLATVILYVILVICIVILIIYYNFKVKIYGICVKRNHRTQVKLNEPDNFALEGGGVMSPRPELLIESAGMDANTVQRT